LSPAESAGVAAGACVPSEMLNVIVMPCDKPHAGGYFAVPRWVRRGILPIIVVSALSTCPILISLTTYSHALEAQAPGYGAKLYFDAGGAGEVPTELAERTARVIVLDAGHGGEDVGAIGPTGLEERTVTLEVTLRLRALLVQGLGCQVILTRETNESVPLPNRTGIANHHKADLFISIHANAHFGGGLEGFTSCIFQPSQNGGRSPGGATASLPGAVSWDSGQLAHLARSRSLASLVQANVAQSALAKDRGVKERPLLLLAGAEMPSVLVEIGFITNHEEELKLKSGAYLERVAELLFQSVKDYFEAQRWYAE